MKETVRYRDDIDREIHRLFLEEMSLRDIGDSVNLSYGAVRYRVKRMRITRKGNRPQWSKEKLASTIAESSSFYEVVEKLGLSTQAGTNAYRIKNRALEYGYDFSHFVPRISVRKPTLSLEEILVENSTYTNTDRIRKRLIASGMKDSRCESCGASEWMEHKLPLELDHINGIKTDNRISNLKVLCPNCHSITPTWKGRNARRQNNPL